MQSYPKIAIIYLSFHCDTYVDDVVSALKRISYPKDRIEFVVVDNPHPEFGSSLKFLEENLVPVSGVEIPHVTILPQKENIGFTGGNNVGIEWAVKNGFDYVFLHNDDGFMVADALEKMVESLESDKSIGAAQAMVLMYPDTELINTSGNSFQYLGFGFCGNFREKYVRDNFDKIFETTYASGAALLMRADLINQFGPLDQDYFLYHEDIEYSFRLKTLGYKTVTVRDAVFYHKYNFSRSKTKFYYIERNRFGLLRSYLKWPTLLLFLPMAIVLEAGMLLFAAKSGWLKEKVRAWRYWLKIENRNIWKEKRRLIQRRRKITDRELIKTFVGSVSYKDRDFQSGLLKYFGNPLMAAYWWIIRKIIFW